MDTFDFCFAWSWPYDRDFVGVLEAACQERQISLLQVTPDDLNEVLLALNTDQLWFNAFFDRASDVEPSFFPLAEWAYRQDLEYINRFWLARRSWDKATMHSQFTRSGLDAPYTVVLPSYLEKPELPDMELGPFGNDYAVKPAHGGGGAGVIVGALTWDQILQARQQNPQDQYLLQAKVTPSQINDRPAWFRMIYCLGKIFPCWWDPFTHLYAPISGIELVNLELTALIDITTRIAHLSRLEIFSTEVAYTSDRRFLVVDYINDPIDLRPQSRIPQGVPDRIVQAIAHELAAHVSGLRVAGIAHA